MRIANEPAAQSAPGTHRPAEAPIIEPPRTRRPDEGERPTSWLEFFFDLVFVVALDQVARSLQHHVDAGSVFRYLALYAPVWWAWVGFVEYTDRFGTDDLSDRLLTLLQIGAVLVIAAAAKEATGERSAIFAAAYGIFRLILALRYALAAVFVRKARPECARQAAGFTVAAAFWLASIAFDGNGRYWLWAGGFAVDLATPFLSPRLHSIVPPDADHLEERFGTFINISLGEGFIGVVEALRDRGWNRAVLVTAALSLLIGFAIWWGYFNSLDKGPVAEVRKHDRTTPYKTWIFAHLPLGAGVAAAGMSVGNLVADADVYPLEASKRWLVCAMVALCYAAHVVVQLAYASAGGGHQSRRIALRKTPTILVVLLVGALGGSLSALGVAGLLALATTAQIVWDLKDRASSQRRA